MGTKLIRLGVIGFSEGNGHPYSWSAICNGYDTVAMETCGFPVIPRYLAQRTWPDDRLPGVAVTHVWAPDLERARHVAKAALIETVVANPEDMIGSIDGLLLARDDAENHIRLAGPFLQAGIPVYVDKPAALSLNEFDRLCAMQAHAGLLFTCTALRFAQELTLDQATQREIGAIRHVFAVTPKSWDKYAVHVIEPTLNLLKDRGSVVRHSGWAEDEARGLMAVFESGAQAHFSAVGSVAAPISMRVIGESGWRDLVFADSFSCFRAAIAEFVEGIRAGFSRTDLAFTRCVVDLLERGRA